MAHPFTAQPLFSSAQLPATLISLDDWALVTLAGPDTVKYLQGQLTADVDALQASQHVLCAHCDAKGKMWSNVRLFHYGDGLAYLERRSVRDTQLAELKKYAVFSKTTIAADDNVVLLGAAGLDIRAQLAPLFDALPDADNAVVRQPGATLLYLPHPAERFLLVLEAQRAAALIETLQPRVQHNDSRQWQALDIAAGQPIIDSANSAQFIPQATNLQALQGISFTKGCYAGQEMVARAKYRGANKRALYWLAGTGAQAPTAGDELEWKLGDNWRRTGTVLAASQLHDGTLWVQAVLNNDLEADNVLRVRDDSGSQLAIQPLPYSLEE
ncbi:tRNA-modifying protein YgfZ [Dickeya dianthicola]|uniref:tRNA-modifying protein YgfZ n=1 Tax=Dickeya dianthicola TaxID=204039 RepID=A0AAP2CXI2_9GAMM|nr:tRNA-modifying protein YgfZ [Dickeya dianthicola]ATO31664.1 Folate-dependent protein for Fe/S cluste synthesis/repair in oxidative stress [Dickeya dianthicola RNS04.9]AYC17588.1 tRNA-modifying protein YgfZ [Dickeya dianthicola]MBI0437802.1 tRNA-modifying protein YgfZ [Dickeya dianthicola]MBI0447951.1 tRNA-modifying protein YgfZ [Dickeya dianthicola]MBI0452568.1 tRNA-modifying protein YgfZ [Dickeya dianthicola]